MTTKLKTSGSAVKAAPAHAKPVSVESANPVLDLAPLESAMKFLEDHDVAYHPAEKSYRLLDPVARRWDELATNELMRRLKDWRLERFGHTARQADLKRTVAELEVNAPLWKPAQHPRFLVVRNGLLDFTSAVPVLRPHQADWQFEHSLAVDYAPTAKCPRFHQFLATTIPDEDATLIQKWAGAMLAGANQSQVILALVGNPGTGKGTLVNLLTHLAGANQTAELRVDKFTERFELSAYIGRRLLIAPEIPSDLLSLKGIGRLKALVGQDRMEGEIKFQHRRVPMNGDFHVILHGNRITAQPWSPDVDAFRRRLLVVEYRGQRPSKVVPNLAEELWSAEAAGILAWAVEGVRRFKADVAAHGTIQLTEAQQRRVDAVIPPAPTRTTSQPSAAPDATGLLTWLSTQLQRFGIRLERVPVNPALRNAN